MTHIEIIRHLSQPHAKFIREIKLNFFCIYKKLNKLNPFPGFVPRNRHIESL